MKAFNIDEPIFLPPPAVLNALGPIPHSAVNELVPPLRNELPLRHDPPLREEPPLNDQPPPPPQPDTRWHAPQQYRYNTYGEGDESEELIKVHHLRYI